MTKLESLKEDFQNALSRLEEVLKVPKTDITRDSAIKRFEIVFDLAWKTIKVFLEEQHGVYCASPRNCFREAFSVGMIEYNEEWLELISDRNYSTHIYKEALAERIYNDLPAKIPLFKQLLEAIK